MMSTHTATATSPRVEPQIRRRLALGLVTTALLIGGIGGWGAYAMISSAIIAPGVIVVEGSDKKVQHPTGGVVGAILVKNGDKVEAGEVIVRLDPTQTKAQLGVVTSQQVQLKGRKSRLEAERDQTASVIFPADFKTSFPEAADIARSEERLFQARQEGKTGQKSQLNERVGQLRKEIEGLTAQLAAKETEILLMTEELARVEGMRKQNLVPVTRLLQSERDLTRLKGENGLLVSNVAKAQGQISEIELQIISLDQTMQTESMKELREVEARLSELLEREVAAQDQLNRIDIKAPRPGIVNDMQIHTVGGVISAGETLMTIVPNDEKLAIEIRVAPTDIDQMQIGQRATLHFSAFNRQQTPEFPGEVSQIAANLTKEPQTGVSYYVARLAISAEKQDEARQLKLVPGMPVETFIETGERTAISYLFKPIRDQISRAFKED
jgi:HlyD family secretion protein